MNRKIFLNYICGPNGPMVEHFRNFIRSLSKDNILPKTEKKLKEKAFHSGQRGFIAKTMETKFCSDNCVKRAYKKRKRGQNIIKSNKETQENIYNP